jgi:hypothetical protein
MLKMILSKKIKCTGTSIGRILKLDDTPRFRNFTGQANSPHLSNELKGYFSKISRKIMPEPYILNRGPIAQRRACRFVGNCH